MKILRASDKVSIKWKDIEVIISPLTFLQKSEIANTQKIQGGNHVSDTALQAFLTIKYCVKEVNGVKCHDDTDYKIVLENNALTDDQCSEVISLLQSTVLVGAIAQVASGSLEIKGVDVKVIPKQ
jgi:hypothetical protein